MSLCAWCEEATGELVVPGRRGSFVHPSCEAKRRGRRSFLLGTAVLAGAAAAAPLLDLVPEVPVQMFPGFVRNITALDIEAQILTGEWAFYMHPAQYEALMVRRALVQGLDVIEVKEKG